MEIIQEPAQVVPGARIGFGVPGFLTHLVHQPVIHLDDGQRIVTLPDRSSRRPSVEPASIRRTQRRPIRSMMGQISPLPMSVVT